MNVVLEQLLQNQGMKMQVYGITWNADLLKHSKFSTWDFISVMQIVKRQMSFVRHILYPTLPDRN